VEKKKELLRSGRVGRDVSDDGCTKSNKRVKGVAQRGGEGHTDQRGQNLWNPPTKNPPPPPKQCQRISQKGETDNYSESHRETAGIGFGETFLLEAGE